MKDYIYILVLQLFTFAAIKPHGVTAKGRFDSFGLGVLSNAADPRFLI